MGYGMRMFGGGLGCFNGRLLAEWLAMSLLTKSRMKDVESLETGV